MLLSRTIGAEDAGRKIKYFVRGDMHVSYHQFSQLKNSGGLRVNGEIVHANYLLREGDIVTAELPELGAEKLVTGHFANIDCVDGEYRLLRAEDENKDQTYFLYMLGQRALSKALFPVGGMTKAQIRQTAREAGLPVSEKKDSTGVCFIGERNFKQFLSNYLPAQPGDMVTPDGRVVGRHDGLMYYTLGQRRGLGIGGGGNGQRWFVLEKDLENNRLVVSQGEDEALFSREAVGSELTWLAECPPVADGVPLDCQVRLRHRQPLQDCRLTLNGGRAHMAFSTPQRAVTPGQSAVFYQGRVCLGGAVVESR